MAKIRETTKRERKERVVLIIGENNGIRESEIATQMQLGRRTIHNYLEELEREGKLWKGGVLWFLAEHRATMLRRVEMSPEQAFTAYIALRLMAKHLDRRNEPAETAMYKLAKMLDSSVEINRDIVEAAEQLAQREPDKAYTDTFREVVQAYLYRRKLAITYKPLNGTPFETIFSTYLIEPVIIGHALYVIGHSETVGAIRSYKLERIQSAKMLQDEYPIPADFPGLNILQNAWSIVFGEETTHVVLRFAPNVAERVRETQWHPSGRPTQDPDKPHHLRYEIDVASTLDLVPWIRSWGADVEVLEPAALREQMQTAVKKMNRLYGLGLNMDAAETMDDRLRKLWGKTSKGGGWHPALYHMLDVGHVAQALLSPELGASPRWRTVLGHVLNADPERLQEWLPYLIALHDIGKITPPFQAKNEGQRTRLREGGFDFGGVTKGMTKTLHHTTVGRHLLETWAKEQFNRPLQYAFLEMVSGHHGAYQTVTEVRKAWPDVQEPEEWEALRGRAMDTLREQFLTNPPDPYPEPENVSAAIAALNGFTILCDWLGSDEAYFEPRPNAELATYITDSHKQAVARVGAADFFHRVHSDKPTAFGALFPSFTTLRPVQAAVDHIPNTVLTEPTLTIIEAPTGEGKTEAAWALAHRIGRLRQTDELYIALPTTATSNAMFTRTEKHLTQRLNLPKTINLIHGQSFLADQFNVEPMDNDDGEPHPALTWFTPKKKALLAPFGVGTIDQAELSTLNVKHNALRMIGLAGKVVILDEVHAYDTYMTTIIKRMLMWLAAMGSSVILLSATLPLKRRRELLAAWTDDVPETTDAYPALMTVGRTTHHIHTDSLQSDRTITLNVAPLHFTDEQAKEKAEWLFEQVKAGGCACWITNLVDQAQQIYQEVAKLVEQENDPQFALDLLHARFPLNQRHEIEQTIMERYTKPGEAKDRPERGIVIGTQVLEQSLDLDFDVMVSDLAPIDLLLQRAGRLHRHERDGRPERHTLPHFYVNTVLADGQLQFGKDKFYGEYILALTWREIARVCAADGEINLPADYRPLIESVYGTNQVETDPLKQYKKEHSDKQNALEGTAKQKLMGKPNSRRPFTHTAKSTFSDEDGVGWLNAQTRYSEQETITAIPLIPLDDETAKLPDADGTVIRLTQKANKETQLLCLRHQIRLSKRKAVNAIKTEPKPAVFQSNLLKRSYPLFVPFHTDEGLTIKLDNQLGLIYEQPTDE